MSMDISPLSRPMPEPLANRMEKVGAAPQIGRKNEGPGPDPADRPHIPRIDEYVPEEPPVPSGLYHVSQDEDGLRKITFDDPDRADSKPDAPPKAGGDQDRAESCTTNTDKVDREIKRLKQKAAGLEQKIAQAQDNPDEQEKLEKQLAQVENELRVKDNDSYRRQHSEFS